MSLGTTVVYEVLPWIDMYFAELKFFHDVFERRQAACDMFWLVSESFQEARSILFTIQADDKSFEHQRSNPDRQNIQRVFLDGAQTIYFSACKTNIPVIKSVGISDCSISTTRIRDVTDIRPPCL